MKDDTMEVEFTLPVRDFLHRRGYSHIIRLGIEPKEFNDANEPETGKENYWLEPVKPEEDNAKTQQTDHIIQEIDHPEIIDIATNGKEDIQYMMKVPVVDYNDYLAKR